MTRYLDIETWHRRETFEFFIGYTNPYFNICTRLDVTALLAFVRNRPGVKVSAAIHYFGLRVANEIEPFRYRLKDGNVIVYDVINGGTTVLRPNESFAYAYFSYHQNFDEFVAEMSKAVDDVRNDTGPLKPTMRDDVIYHTTLPWISFTSFSHARTPGRGDSVPRFVFGKFTEENGRTMMPFSVEVHHALVDGLHVGQYLELFQEMLTNPEKFLSLG
ncbi:MAG TPA: chloramphenicol acetyltransferase [Pyrinomonadaceae bacterium]|nr:chloramphenicol acetyltransferase [Pyrinomonadaceae bacterium]